MDIVWLYCSKCGSVMLRGATYAQEKYNKLEVWQRVYTPEEMQDNFPPNLFYFISVKLGLDK
ncbi:unnamed protein product [marine sediment metagenome]|uniref:Uncharacterized protein n=1 Tax=marine sediment metagenome TaxID=412755 RepID=X0Z981_9ZZZZ